MIALKALCIMSIELPPSQSSEIGELDLPSDDEGLTALEISGPSSLAVAWETFGRRSAHGYVVGFTTDLRPKCYAGSLGDLWPKICAWLRSRLYYCCHRSPAQGLPSVFGDIVGRRSAHGYVVGFTIPVTDLRPKCSGGSLGDLWPKICTWLRSRIYYRSPAQGFPVVVGATLGWRSAHGYIVWSCH